MAFGVRAAYGPNTQAHPKCLGYDVPWESLVVCDFFTVEAWTLGELLKSCYPQAA